MQSEVSIVNEKRLLRSAGDITTASGSVLLANFRSLLAEINSC